jgi:glutathione S-transferase
MWMDWQQNTVMTGLSPLFLGLVRTPPERRDETALRAAAATVERALALLDGQLAGRQYLLGDRLTVADIPLGVADYRWYALPVEHMELKNVRSWYERLTSRPAFATHVMIPLS